MNSFFHTNKKEYAGLAQKAPFVPFSNKKWGSKSIKRYPFFLILVSEFFEYSSNDRPNEKFGTRSLYEEKIDPRPQNKTTIPNGKFLFNAIFSNKNRVQTAVFHKKEQGGK